MVFRFGCVAHARIYFSERFCLPRWLCWRLALCCRLLCFVRLTALPPLGFCSLGFASAQCVGLPLRSPLHFGIFAALPWSCRCARRCTSGFSLRCRGAAAALAVAFRAFRCAAVEPPLRSLVLLRASSLRRRWLLCFRGGRRCAVPCRLSFSLAGSDGWRRRLTKGVTPSCWLTPSTGILEAVTA